MSDWQPSAALPMLRERARIIASIRQFFAERDVLEVDTPLLSHATVTDVHLHTFSTEFISPLSPDTQTLYLQTSPEYAMKRLLSAGCGAIYQLSKAFRNEEAGRYHNPEFTMLEWYRPGFDHVDLMHEVSELTQRVLGCEAAEQMSYQQAFEQALGVDPLAISDAALQDVCRHQGFAEFADGQTDRDTLLQLLFSHCIEPHIGQQRPALVYHFPASQAALARLDDNDPRVARRFELYFKGIELANGFHELSDAEEQRKRFEHDNTQRKAMGLAAKPIDDRLLAALASGLPDCAGVALGVDRLIMLATEATDIQQVLSFSVHNA